MKKYAIVLLLMMLCLSLCGCGETHDGSRYEVYFSSKDQTFGAPALASESCYMEEDAVIPELLRLLLAGPTDEQRLKAIIPKGVLLRDWSLRDGLLTVDFSSRYGLLSGIDLTLADYSVTMSLTQAPGVTAVRTMVEGDRISYRDRDSLKEEDIFFSVSRHEPQQQQVTLFFPKKEGEDLGQETRQLLLTADDSLLPAVLLALMAEPESRSLSVVLREGDLLSQETKGRVCQLNLTEGFVKRAPTEVDAARLALESLTQTLCELDTISAVEFFVEGKAMVAYGPLQLEGALAGDWQATK